MKGPTRRQIRHSWKLPYRGYVIRRRTNFGPGFYITKDGRTVHHHVNTIENAKGMIHRMRRERNDE